MSAIECAANAARAIEVANPGTSGSAASMAMRGLKVAEKINIFKLRSPTGEAIGVGVLGDAVSGELLQSWAHFRDECIYSWNLGYDMVVYGDPDRTDAEAMLDEQSCKFVEPCFAQGLTLGTARIVPGNFRNGLVVADIPATFGCFASKKELRKRATSLVVSAHLRTSGSAQNPDWQWFLGQVIWNPPLDIILGQLRQVNTLALTDEPHQVEEHADQQDEEEQIESEISEIDEDGDNKLRDWIDVKKPRNKGEGKGKGHNKGKKGRNTFSNKGDGKGKGHNKGKKGRNTFGNKGKGVSSSSSSSAWSAPWW